MSIVTQAPPTLPAELAKEVAAKNMAFHLDLSLHLRPGLRASKCVLAGGTSWVKLVSEDSEITIFGNAENYLLLAATFVSAAAEVLNQARESENE